MKDYISIMRRSTPKRKPALGYRVRPESEPYTPTPEHGPLEFQQAPKIFRAFGGPAALAFALNQLPDRKYHRERSVIYKWGYPRSKNGTSGYIPVNMHGAVKAAARLMGVVLTDEDWRL